MRRQDIENLSNLVFGLSLSIVALILISNPADNPREMAEDLLWFAFSFMIVISVWKAYVGIVAEMEVWNRRDVQLNIFLLLLVGLEPYLFNAITFGNERLPLSDQDLMNNLGTMAFAINIALILLIIAIYYHIMSKEPARPDANRSRYIRERNQRIITGSMFAASALPWFWGIKLGSMEVRYVIWFFPLLFVLANMIRLVLTKDNGKEEEDEEST